MSAQLNSAQLNSAQLNPAPSPPLAPSSLLFSLSTGSDYLPFSALRLRLLFTLRPCALGALHVLRNSKIEGFEDHLGPWALSLVAVPLVSQTPANLRKPLQNPAHLPRSDVTHIRESVNPWIREFRRRPGSTLSAQVTGKCRSLCLYNNNQ